MSIADRNPNEWPPRHTRPKLRARVYRLNLMAVKNASICEMSYYTHRYPRRRCPWCHRPIWWKYNAQWPGLCACCGWLLNKWQDPFTFNQFWLIDEIPF